MCNINQRLKDLQTKEATMKFLVGVNDVFSKVKNTNLAHGIHYLLLIRLILCSSKRKCKDLSPILLEFSLLFWLPRAQATIQKERKGLYAFTVESLVILWINVTNSMVFHQVTNSRTGI